MTANATTPARVDLADTELANSVIGIFDTHMQAERAVRELAKSGFDMAKLSILGKGYHSEEHPVGFYTTGDRMKSWGGIGAFWGGLWGMLLGGAFFWVPGVGPLAVAGPLVQLLVAGLEGAALVGGMGAVGAALVGLGVSKTSVVKYETELKANKYLVIAHGLPHEVTEARSILEQSAAVETEMVTTGSSRIAQHVSIS